MWDINARHQRFSLWKGFNRTTWEVSKRFLMKKEQWGMMFPQNCSNRGQGVQKSLFMPYLEVLLQVQ